MQRLEKIFEKILETRISVFMWASVFLAMIMLRGFIEQFIAKSLPLSPQESLIEFIHNLYFFLLTIVLIWLFLAFIIKINPKKLSLVMAGASFLMLLPPIFDMIKSGGQIFWSFYLLSSPSDLWKQFISIFGNLPSGIVYFGTKMTFIGAIIASSGLVFIKTKNWLKTALNVLAIYIILFFMGSFPTIFTYIYSFLTRTQEVSQIKAFQIAQFIGSPQKIWGIDSLNFKYSFAYKLDFIYYPFLIFLLGVLFFAINKEKFISVIKNFRYPQIIYHSGLFLAGMGLGIVNFPENFGLDVFSFASMLVLLISIWLAWKASVVVNDIYDLEVDKISNPDRPLPLGIFDLDGYSQFGVICFLLSLLGGITVGFNFFFLLLVYQILAWFYSAPPFRLKKFPVIATFVSSLASIMVLFMGYILLSGDNGIQTLSWRITLLLVISYTISIPIKDFKDIKGDGKYGIRTIPVIFGEEKAKLIVAVNLFVSYMLSVFFLNEMKLFFWAMIFGMVTFSAVVWGKINPRKIFWWILGIVGCYGLVLIKIAFLR